MRKSMEKRGLSTRRNVENILVPHNDGFNIHDTFAWYIHAFQEKTGIVCEAKCQLHDRIAESRQAAVLFQIFEEILINIARHADSTKVCISLGDHAGIMILRVMDNGRGIEDGSLHVNGFRGLAGMRAYARLCGGEFRISSIPGKGTTVIVSVPVCRSRTAEFGGRSNGGF
jgi:signal transduction histidine kinase